MTSAQQQHPMLIFGTGNVGSDAYGTYRTKEAVSALLDDLQRLGVRHIDTAAGYPVEKGEVCEKLLGEAGIGSRPDFVVDTKIYWNPAVPSDGTMSAHKVADSTAASLARLKLDRVEVLFCHNPDPTTPLEEQIDALEDQRKKGYCKAVGVSNFSPEMLEEWISITIRKGYPLPAACQGKYNLVERDAEAKILPILRRHGIPFRAWSPLGGGFLTGLPTDKASAKGSRFDPEGLFGKLMLGQYDKPDLNDAVRALRQLVAEHEAEIEGGVLEAALRWISFHSALGPQDGMLLGASRVSQLESNLAAIAKGPLPAAVASGIEEIGKAIRPAEAAPAKYEVPRV